MDPTEANRRLAQQFNEAFNRGDLDAAASCFTEDCRNHGRQVGRAGVRMVLEEIKTNFPNARLTTLNSVTEGEWIVVRCSYDASPFNGLDVETKFSPSPAEGEVFFLTSLL